MSKSVIVKTFAQVREICGEGELALTLNGEKTIADVQLTLQGKSDKWQLALTGAIICAKNQQLCDANTAIAAGDEVAFFPPVTGG